MNWLFRLWLSIGAIKTNQNRELHNIQQINYAKRMVLGQKSMQLPNEYNVLNIIVKICRQKSRPLTLKQIIINTSYAAFQQEDIYIYKYTSI